MVGRIGHHRYTYADYVAVERDSSTKHEFLDGEIFAMAGGTEDHSAFCTEVLFALRGALGAELAVDTVYRGSTLP